MKKVLVVAGEYPPVKTIGRIRTVKFIQHIRQMGWEPLVLTILPKSNEVDNSLLDEIPEGVQIFRIPCTDYEREVAYFVKKILGKQAYTPANSGINDASIRNDNTNKPAQIIKSYIINTFKWLLKYWIYIPDNYIGWANEASKQALKICQDNKIDVIYTTLPPFSACKIGYTVRKKLGIPWVVDYRDLWHGDVLREWIGPVRSRLELWQEKRYMKKADIIISVSQQKTEFLKQLHPTTTAEWVTLTNGFDSDLYEPLLGKSRIVDSYINFVYTGRLFKNRKGFAFAEALGQISLEHPKLVENVRVHFLGGVEPSIYEKYLEILTKYKIEDKVIFAGDLSYQKAMQAQVNADYLLLIVDTGRTSDGVIPGKLFEYIAAQRPIFALTGEGATQEIIEKGNLGVVVPVHSVELCKQSLLKILSEPIPETLHPNKKYIEQFDRKVLSSRLVGLLNKLST